MPDSTHPELDCAASGTATGRRKVNEGVYLPKAMSCIGVVHSEAVVEKRSKKESPFWGVHPLRLGKSAKDSDAGLPDALSGHHKRRWNRCL